ncbi:hypothetical protein FBU30_002656 [Linnemannia zychae]|nr:hypothetical protein FBU30_002656 [Linnemannia zychae]
MTLLPILPDIIPDNSGSRPHVIIIGAGLAGLSLAILLQRAGITYDIYEKSADIKNFAPLFTQMGIMEEYLENSMLCSSIRLFNENRKQDFKLDLTYLRELSGFDGRLVPRKVLYEIILRHIPEDRIHRGMRLLYISQGDKHVICKFQEKTEIAGDIVVGADGSYSAVRQSMFEYLREKGMLCPQDLVDVPANCVCVGGYTISLDPEKYTFLKEEHSSVINTRSFHKPYSVRTTDWGHGGAADMCNEIRDFPICGGDGTLTLGDLIDNTPCDQLAKLTLEERVFETWYFGRVVLIGDACHKLHPAGGQGATAAFHDALALANWINALPSNHIRDIEAAFKSYKDERYVVALQYTALAKQMCKLYGKANDYSAVFVRFFLKKMPFRLWKRIMVKMILCRPQASFLPSVPNTGTVPPEEPPSYTKTLSILRARELEETEMMNQVLVQVENEVSPVVL